MSGSVNKVILVGNLADEPTFATLNNGGEVANMRLITSESWKDRETQEKRSRAQGHNIVVYNENIVRVIRDYCHKGTKLYIEGSLETRKYQDSNGVDKYVTEVVVQKYRGEMTLMGDRPADDGAFEGGARGGNAGGADRDRPRDGNRGGAAPRSADRDDNRQRDDSRGRQPAPAGRGRNDDYDDEVPF